LLKATQLVKFNLHSVQLSERRIDIAALGTRENWNLLIN